MARDPLRHGRRHDRLPSRRIELPTRAALEELWSWTAPVRDELRIDAPAEQPNGAQRQRAALLAGASLRDVYAETVRETTTTYAQEVPA